jgi:hypothetical protein
LSIVLFFCVLRCLYFIDNCMSCNDNFIWELCQMSWTEMKWNELKWNDVIWSNSRVSWGPTKKVKCSFVACCQFVQKNNSSYKNENVLVNSISISLFHFRFRLCLSSTKFKWKMKKLLSWFKDICNIKIR